MSTAREKREAIEYSLEILKKTLGALELKKSQRIITSAESQELAACRRCIQMGKELLSGR